MGNSALRDMRTQHDRDQTAHVSDAKVWLITAMTYCAPSCAIDVQTCPPS